MGRRPIDKSVGCLTAGNLRFSERSGCNEADSPNEKTAGAWKVRCGPNVISTVSTENGRTSPRGGISALRAIDEEADILHGHPFRLSVEHGDKTVC